MARRAAAVKTQNMEEQKKDSEMAVARTLAAVSKVQSEISTWEFLASTLTQEHQQNVKADILRNVRSLKQHLKEITCTHPLESLKDYHDMSILCTKCNNVIFQDFNGEKLMNKRRELGMS